MKEGKRDGFTLRESVSFLVNCFSLQSAWRSLMKGRGTGLSIDYSYI
ncbi:hypothetical protein KR50_21210 [Jeotgalibacillus campisalis]|uniref:Uncharacterized protein n=1 Tax=Jeotgalibacillus campisalis TaxID=220754 RepID=A0A0C2S1N8_9BACL|nr:hypothetical protein KR50_21210 [Jeotgalibacillus campisalis]